MKKIGLIGGLGPESTIEYYKGIINAFKPEYEINGYPDIIIESVNLKYFVELAGNNEWEKMSDILAEKCDALKNAGAEFGAITSNTPHNAFNLIKEKTSLPLISIVEATCNYAGKSGLKKLCLMGTQFTMSAHYYQDVFDKKNIELILPSIEEQDYIHTKLFAEIEHGIIKQDTKNRLLLIYQRIEQNYKTEGLILGCTELPLIIKPEDIKTKYIDTIAVHIDEIVKYCKK